MCYVISMIDTFAKSHKVVCDINDRHIQKARMRTRQGYGNIHTRHQFSIRILVNNVWKTMRTDRCDRLHYEVEGYESDCK